MKTVKAIIKTNGTIELLEPLELTEQHQAIITILEPVQTETQLRP